jgi:3-oxoacyl-[acyl-carrier protein] reductase
MARSLFDLTGRSALVSDVDADAASAVAERICAAGGKAEGIVLDVRDRAAAEAAVARAAGLSGGKLHILVNNAGVTAPGMFADLTDESFHRVLDIHLSGAVHCARAALGFLPTDGTGRDHRHAGPGKLLGRQGQHHRTHQITGA